MMVLKGIKALVSKDKRSSDNAQSSKNEKKHSEQLHPSEQPQRSSEQLQRLKKDKHHKDQILSVSASSNSDQLVEEKSDSVAATRPKETRREEKNHNTTKSAVTESSPIIPAQNGSTSTRTIASVLSAPSLSGELRPLSANCSESEKAKHVAVQHSSGDLRPPGANCSSSISSKDISALPFLMLMNTLSTDLQQRVGRDLVKKRDDNSFVSADYSYIVKASATCRFFKDFRDLFFIDKNCREGDKFSEILFERAKEKFYEIKYSLIEVTPDNKSSIITPLNAEKKEKLLSLLMQMRWAASVAYSSEVQHRLYAAHYECYRSLKLTWGITLGERKETQFYLDGLSAEVNQIANSIDTNRLFFHTPAEIRIEMIKKYEKIFYDLKEEENKRIFISEVLRVIEQLKMDEIIDVITKKIQFHKIIIKDDPLASTRNNSEVTQSKVKHDICVVVEKLKQLKVKGQAIMSTDKQTEANFDALINGAIKRIASLKLKPYEMYCLSSAIPANGPPLDIMLEEAVKKISHLRDSLNHAIHKDDLEPRVNDGFQKQMNDQQILWQSRLQQIDEICTAHSVVRSL